MFMRMELKKYITPLFVFMIMFSAAAARASECPRYRDGDFHYSICVPGDWKKSASEEGEIHRLVMKKGGAEISITASPAEKDPSEGNGWKKCRGQGCRKIIETRELSAGDTVAVKFVVFDYSSRGVRILQRSMLSRYGDKYLA